MQTLRIFISSPGDVSRERERAREVIESLRRRYAGRLMLQPVFWEDLPLQADMSFQQGIDVMLSEHGADIAVFILWSRLGSPVGSAIPKPDGGEYRSGTEREYDLMMEARSRSRTRGDDPVRPAILVYTRRDEPSFEERLRGKSTAEKKSLLQQKELVESFIQESFRDLETGVNVGAYFSFDRPVAFSERLRAHLQSLLDERAGETGDVFWDSDKLGPPYLGLAAFQPQHTAIFFGREEEVLEARTALREQAREGCAFLLLSGSSGSGKSSLARAGVLPAIVENEIDDQVAAWLPLIVTPAELAPDLVAGLATRLGAEDLLPGLSPDRSAMEDLIAGLRENPDLTFRLKIKPALHSAASNHDGGVRILLVLDQLEELFSMPELTPAQRQTFLAIIESLARSGQVWVVATLRSDFYSQAQSEPALMRMKSGHGQLDVVAPGPDSLSRLIEEPARLAGLSFEVRDGQSLASRILKDAASHAELLPLVEFVLRELYEKCAGSRSLSYAAYEALGGVEGAVAQRAEQLYAELPVASQSALGEVLESLVTLGSDEEGASMPGEKPVRLLAPQAAFAERPEAKLLVERFIEARLFIAARIGTSGEAGVSVAHESLLRVWPRAVEWRERNLDFLRTRARIAARMRDGSPLLEGDPLLVAAKAFLAIRGTGFSEEQRTWIGQAVEQADVRARKAARRRRAAFAGLSVLAAVASVAAVFAIANGRKAGRNANEADRQANLAKAETGRAEAALQQSQRQLERSSLEEGRAWLERAVNARDHNDPLLALLWAGRACGYQDYGRREEETAAFQSEYPLLLARPAGTDANLEQDRKVEWQRLQNFAASVYPRVLPVWGSPLNQHEQSVICALTYSPDGRILAVAAEHLRLWDVESGKLIGDLEGRVAWGGALSFSPDGKWIASSATDGSIRIWDVAARKLARNLQGHAKTAMCLAFSRDGKKLVSGGEDKTVRLWDVDSGEQIGMFLGHEDEVSCVAFTADEKRVLAGAWNGMVRAWETETGAPVMAIRAHEQAVSGVIASSDNRHFITSSWVGDIRFWDEKGGEAREPLGLKADAINVLAVAPDQKGFAAGTKDGVVVLLDGEGREVGRIAAHSEDINGLAFSPDGKRLASGGRDRVIKQWDVATHQQIGSPAGHRDTVTGLAFSPLGDRVATASWDGTVKFWSARTGQTLSEIPSVGGRLSSLSYSPDGSRIAVGSEDGPVTLWNASDGSRAGVLGEESSFSSSVAFSPDGSLLATASAAEADVRIWDLATGKQKLQLRGHRQRVRDIAFSPDGRRIATAGWEGLAKVWDMETGSEIGSFHGADSYYASAIDSIAFSPDGERIAFGAAENEINVVELSSGKTLAKLKGHNEIVISLAFSPDGRWLLSGSGDRCVKLWNMQRFQSAATIHVHEAEVCRVAFAPDGRRFATTSNDGTAKLWDFQPGPQRRDLAPLREETNSAAWSPDGTMIAAGSKSGIIDLWDARSGRPLAMFQTQEGADTPAEVVIAKLVFSPDGGTLLCSSTAGSVSQWDLSTGLERPLERKHSLNVGGLAYSPDGRFFATGSADRLVRLWDAKTGTVLKTFEGHDNSVESVSFSPDGTTLASGSSDEHVRLWDLKGAQEPRVISAMGGRISCVAYSPDGANLAVGFEGSPAVLLDVASGKAVRRFAGPENWVNSLAFRPDGLRLASAVSGGRVMFWDTQSGEMVGSHRFPSYIISHVSYSPDGRQVVVASDQDYTQLWDASDQTTGPDLASLLRDKVCDVSSQGFFWNTRSSLTNSSGFRTLESGDEDLDGMEAKAISPDRRLELAMRVFSKGRQWRAAIYEWRRSSRETTVKPVPPGAPGRCNYLTLLCATGADLPLLERSADGPVIAAAVNEALTRESLADQRVALTLALFMHQALEWDSLAKSLELQALAGKCLKLMSPAATEALRKDLDAAAH